jgi:putative hydrolase of the HAD superfamily
MAFSTGLGSIARHSRKRFRGLSLPLRGHQEIHRDGTPWGQTGSVRAVFFDVDFTLIYPGPTFQSEGYLLFARNHGLVVDVAAFDRAVDSAAPILEEPDEARYDAEIFVRYTRHILEMMGGRGDALDACAREISDEWAACRHFELYDEVADVLRELVAAGIRIGLISNSHRCLDSFQSHFKLQGLIDYTISSSDHGYMKPHPSIFHAALEGVNVFATQAMMVGDHVRQDVEGALGAGMRAAFLHRGPIRHPSEEDLANRGVPVVRSLRELRDLLFAS